LNTDATPEVIEHLRMIDRRTAEERFIDNENAPVRDFVNLAGHQNRNYYPLMWQEVSGKLRPMREIVKDHLSVIRSTYYVGLDEVGDAVAAMAIGRFHDKDSIARKITKSRARGNWKPLPQDPAKKTSFLTDIYLDSNSSDGEFINARVMFYAYLKAVIMGNPNQRDIERIVAFSDSPRRNTALIKIGFERAPLPKKGTLTFETGRDHFEEFDYQKVARQKYEMFVYEIDREVLQMPLTIQLNSNPDLPSQIVIDINGMTIE